MTWFDLNLHRQNKIKSFKENYPNKDFFFIAHHSCRKNLFVFKKELKIDLLDNHIFEGNWVIFFNALHREEQMLKTSRKLLKI